MELSIRDWLLIIGVLLLIAIALDGYRRARKERFNQVRLSKNAKRAAKKHKPEDPPVDTVNLGKRAVNPLATDAMLNQASTELKKPKQSDPVLYDEIDPLFADTSVLSETEITAVDEPSNETTTAESNLQQPNQIQEDPLLSEDRQVPSLETEAQSEPELSQAKLFETTPEEVILLNVMPQTAGEKLDGTRLKAVLDACDCRFTAQHIFCRFERENGQGDIQFSLVNMVEPGTFSEQDFLGRNISGISLLLCLPGPKNPYEALTCMIETAQCLAKNLNACLTDEHLSSVTEQRLEHHRQQVRDYLKRKLLSPTTI